MAVVAATIRNVRSVTATASLTRIPSRMSEAVPAELVVQRLQADAEDLGGLRLVVAVPRQRLQDQALLGMVEARADSERDGVGDVGDGLARARGGSRREVPERDHPARAHDHPAPDGIEEPPHP